MIFNLKHYETKLHIGTVVGTDYKRSEGLKADTLEIFYNDTLVFIGRVLGMVDDSFSDNSLNVYVYMD